MKRKLIAMLMIGIMTFSMVACGDKDKETNTDSSNDTVVEENENDETKVEDEEDEEISNNIKRGAMTDDEKFEHNKKVSRELLEYLKQNNINHKIIENREDGSKFWIKFDQKIDDMRVSVTYKYTNGGNLQATIYVFYDKEQAKAGTVNIDIDRTMVPKIHEIVTGNKNKSYEKYKNDLNKVANNTLKEEPSGDIPTTFKEHLDIENFGELIEIADGSDSVYVIISAN